jgi:hypothetical protein
MIRELIAGIEVRSLLGLQHELKLRAEPEFVGFVRFINSGIFFHRRSALVKQDDHLRMKSQSVDYPDRITRTTTVKMPYSLVNN